MKCSLTFESPIYWCYLDAVLTDPHLTNATIEHNSLPFSHLEIGEADGNESIFSEKFYLAYFTNQTTAIFSTISETFNPSSKIKTKQDNE